MSGSAALLSDYRFRGVSLSDRQPVAEASGLASTASGWFAGVEGIAIARPRDLRSSRTAEVDLSAGWSRPLGLLTPTAGVIGYVYPGRRGSVIEGFGSLAGALGPATLIVGANYAPDQAAVAGGNLYVYARASVGIPLTPVTLRAAAGCERGGFDGGRAKMDYRAGADVRVWIVTLGLDYVGNDVPRTVTQALRHDSGNAIVGSVTLAF